MSESGAVAGRADLGWGGVDHIHDCPCARHAQDGNGLIRVQVRRIGQTAPVPFRRLGVGLVARRLTFGAGRVNVGFVLRSECETIVELPSRL